MKLIRVATVIVFVVLLSGCNLQFWNNNGEEARPAKQKEDSREVRDFSIVVAKPPVGQNKNPVRTVDEYQDALAGIEGTVTLFLNNMLSGNIVDAASCVSGLDVVQNSKSVGDSSMEELQAEIVNLQPVDWRLTEMKLTAGGDKALVKMEFTMPDGSQLETGTFAVVRENDLWLVHYPSFSSSFHNMAVLYLGKHRERN